MKKTKQIKHWQNFLVHNIVTELNGVLHEEAWEDISGYEGLYQVSDFGRVKRLETFTKNGLGGCCYDFHSPEKIHKYHINMRGMPRIQLSNSGVNWIYSISRLVAVAFLPNPKKLPMVCHKDDNPLNNSSDNLFWGTQKDNMEDKCRKQRQARGEKNNQARFTTKQILRIRRVYDKEKCNYSMLAREYGVSATAIMQIIKRKHWKHV